MKIKHIYKGFDDATKIRIFIYDDGDWGECEYEGYIFDMPVKFLDLVVGEGSIHFRKDGYVDIYGEWH